MHDKKINIHINATDKKIANYTIYMYDKKAIIHINNNNALKDRIKTRMTR